ncbi:MAG: hypothetical protein M0C28_10690 [Candidatus Moduliflexus flocculans]|nr:hypothetical protein [Candidatus Moduliflexus flocculans]
MAAVYSLMTLTQKTSTSLDRKVITQQDTRTVLDLMAMEIRMASFNPMHEIQTWSNASPLACMPAVSPRQQGD